MCGCREGLPTERIVESDPPVIAEARTPALSGGTLVVTRDGAVAVVADPERDRVVLVHIASGETREIPLEPGDEPGRVAEDANGRVHVALRRSRTLATIDLESASVVGRREVCTDPRGVAYDEGTDQILVACAGGLLARLAAAPGGGFGEVVHVTSDLRDVIVQPDGRAAVTLFRSAELVDVRAEGGMTNRRPARSQEDSFTLEHTPHVAWRSIGMADGSVVMVHELSLATEVPETQDPVDPNQGQYTSFGCEESLVRTGITVFAPDGGTRLIAGDALSRLHLPIDVAVTKSGSRVAVIDPSASVAVEIALADQPETASCLDMEYSLTWPVGEGTPIAAAYAGDVLLVQTREPSRLVQIEADHPNRVIELGGASRADTGFDLFHNIGGVGTMSGLACASCHPEGRDDGHTWQFAEEGKRRSQSLAGTLSGTAPFHWSGNLETFDALVEEVFTQRMGGPRESKARIAALEKWVVGFEPIAGAPVDDAEAVERGKALFESEQLGCATCHSGPSFTNNATVALGDAEPMQVPSLIGLASRAPYMHDGCAETILARFRPECGGGDDHGVTSHLSDPDLADLAAYLGTL